MHLLILLTVYLNKIRINSKNFDIIKNCCCLYSLQIEHPTWFYLFHQQHICKLSPSSPHFNVFLFVFILKIVTMLMNLIILQRYHEILDAFHVESMATGESFIGERLIAEGTDGCGIITLGITILILWLIMGLTINSLMRYSHRRCPIH